MKPVLLVNACLIGDNNGTGNTLASIFKSVPENSVYELCIDFLRKPEQNKHYCYVDKHFSFFRYLLAKRRTHTQQTENAAKHRANISGARASGFKAVVHEIFRGLADILPIKISADMHNFILNAKPDYIYTCGSSITSLKTARKIAKKYSLPLVLHIMDNWEATLYTSSVFTKPFSMILKSELKKANKFSKSSLAISESLCQKFALKYGVNYLPLMNTVDNIKAEPKCFKREKLIFLYAGSLSINRYVSLCEVAGSLTEAFGNEGYEFRLFVPANQNTEEMHNMFKHFNVKFSDYIPRDQLFIEYDNADVLVIAESFDKNFCDFTKYSLSTKLPEYMSSGKPILAYLSKDLYSYNYLSDSKSAVVAGSKAELMEKVKHLSDFDFRYSLAENGIKFVKKHNSRDYCNKILSEIFK